MDDSSCIFTTTAPNYRRPCATHSPSWRQQSSTSAVWIFQNLSKQQVLSHLLAASHLHQHRKYSGVWQSCHSPTRYSIHIWHQYASRLTRTLRNESLQAPIKSLERSLIGTTQRSLSYIELHPLQSQPRKRSGLASATRYLWLKCKSTRQVSPMQSAEV